MQIRKATYSDAAYLFERLAKADRIEMQLLDCQYPLAELLASVARPNTYAVLVEGKVAAMFGCVAKQGYAKPWMLSTDQIYKARMLARQGRGIVDEWTKQYTYLTNVAWSGNRAHLKWIDWLGFEFVGTETYSDQIFVRFEKHV